MFYNYFEGDQYQSTGYTLIINSHTIVLLTLTASAQFPESKFESIITEPNWKVLWDGGVGYFFVC